MVTSIKKSLSKNPHCLTCRRNLPRNQFRKLYSIGRGLCESCATKKDSLKSLNGDGFIYFIQANDPNHLIKIGYTATIKTRLNALRTSSPVNLELIGVKEGSFKDEKDIHEKFNHALSHGEWYYPVSELVEFIQLETRVLAIP